MVISTGINGEMGRNGQLIWQHPGDMAHFKRITLGGTVIMGRKTWESLPDQGLPGRRIAVLSKTHAGPAFYTDIYKILEKTPGPHYLIGGAEICRAYEHLCQELWWTRFDASCPDADAIYQPIVRHVGQMLLKTQSVEWCPRARWASDRLLLYGTDGCPGAEIYHCKRVITH